MKNRGGKLVLVLATLVLLVVLALGSVAPGVAARVVEPQAGAVEVFDGLHGVWADPMAGGGSNS